MTCDDEGTWCTLARTPSRSVSDRRSRSARPARRLGGHAAAGIPSTRRWRVRLGRALMLLFPGWNVSSLWLFAVHETGLLRGQATLRVVSVGPIGAGVTGSADERARRGPGVSVLRHP